MNFIHDDPEFDDLLRIVAGNRKLSLALVEKDYWVTHTLWALHAEGFDVWFKGGTSLSKGFSLINRFSEDLDLKIEPGRTPLPSVSNWKGDGTKATNERRTYFETLPSLLRVPGTTAELDPNATDARWRNGHVRVSYPARHRGDLADVLSSSFALFRRSQQQRPEGYREAGPGGFDAPGAPPGSPKVQASNKPDEA